MSDINFSNSELDERIFNYALKCTVRSAFPDCVACYCSLINVIFIDGRYSFLSSQIDKSSEKTRVLRQWHRP